MSIAVKTTKSVPLQRIADMLIGAREGGSNYWAEQIETVYPEGTNRLAERDARGVADLLGRMSADDAAELMADRSPFALYLLPFVPGGAWIVTVDEDAAKHTLDRARLETGLQIMADKYPKHFSDLVQENDDATTADVYLQCCLFGEIVYG